MTVSDTDLETLETFLDGELPEAETEILRRRLIFEPLLAQTLEALRSERAVRIQVWKSMEPAQGAITHAVARVDRGVGNHLWWARTLSRTRMISAAAACIVLGLFLGRFGNFHQDAKQPMAKPAEVAEAKPAPTVDVSFVDEYGHPVATQKLTAQEAAQLTNDFRRENERRTGPNGGAVLVDSPTPEGKF